MATASERDPAAAPPSNQIAQPPLVCRPHPSSIATRTTLPLENQIYSAMELVGGEVKTTNKTRVRGKLHKLDFGLPPGDIGGLQSIAEDMNTSSNMFSHGSVNSTLHNAQGYSFQHLLQVVSSGSIDLKHLCATQQVCKTPETHEAIHKESGDYESDSGNEEDRNNYEDGYLQSGEEEDSDTDNCHGQDEDDMEDLDVVGRCSTAANTEASDEDDDDYGPWEWDNNTDTGLDSGHGEQETEVCQVLEKLDKKDDGTYDLDNIDWDRFYSSGDLVRLLPTASAAKVSDGGGGGVL